MNESTLYNAEKNEHFNESGGGGARSCLLYRVSYAWKTATINRKWVCWDGLLQTRRAQMLTHLRQLGYFNHASWNFWHLAVS